MYNGPHLNKPRDSTMIEIGSTLLNKLVQFHTYDEDGCHRDEEEKHLTLGGVYRVFSFDAFGSYREDVYHVIGNSGEIVLLYLHQFNVVGEYDANKNHK